MPGREREFQESVLRRCEWVRFSGVIMLRLTVVSPRVEPGIEAIRLQNTFITNIKQHKFDTVTSD